MFEKGKKILGYTIPMKAIAVIALLALAAMLIPILRLTIYSVPWYDDYNYGSFARTGMEIAGSKWGALQGALDCVRTQWHAWQGTYSSIFFMSLVPVIWGEQWYFLGPVFIIVLLIISVFVLVKVLVRDVLGADKASCLTLQAVTAGMILALMHTVQLGIYWYNAAIHYVGMQSFCMLFVSVLILLLLPQGKGKTVVLTLVSVLLASIVAGANFVTALQGGILIMTIGAVGIWWMRRPKKVLLLLPSLCVYAFGFYKNVAAPGNSVRARSYVGWGYDPVMSVLRSFLEGAGHAWRFTGPMTLAILVILVPVIWQMLKKCNFSFKLPGLILLWSICLYAAGFTPSLYSLGHAGLARTLNAVKITWQLLLLLNEIYWLGWLQGYLKQKGKKVFSGKISWTFYPLMGVCMLIIFFLTSNKFGNYSPYGAYYFIHSGEAYNFRAQYMERIELLESDQTVLVFEPYRFKPWYICIGDLSDNPGSEENRSVASWYDKSSVMIEQKE